MTKKESYFAGLHILMRAILMAQRTLVAGFVDTDIEKAADRSASAGKNLSGYILLRNLRLKNSRLYSLFLRAFVRTKTNQRQSAKSAFKIRVNPRLINDLRSTKVYVRKNNLFMQNKANFRKNQMNVTDLLTRKYDKKDTWSSGKNKPNSNPIQSQSNPIKANKRPKQTQYKPKQTQFYNLVCLQSPIFPENLLINPMNRICCLCCFSVPLDSAKMALYTADCNLNKDGRKKLNLLRCKRLNGPGRMRALTGTIFAHSYLQKFLCTDDTQ
jgi:hypothetical protein